jgi:hypothetical protein
MSEASPDFAGTVALIALISDTKACAKRLDELRKLGAETAKHSRSSTPIAPPMRRS